VDRSHQEYSTIKKIYKLMWRIILALPVGIILLLVAEKIDSRTLSITGAILGVVGASFSLYAIISNKFKKGKKVANV